MPELSDLVEKIGPEDGVESDIQVAIIDKTGKVISASPENNYGFGDDIEMILKCSLISFYVEFKFVYVLFNEVCSYIICWKE